MSLFLFAAVNKWHIYKTYSPVLSFPAPLKSLYKLKKIIYIQYHLVQTLQNAMWCWCLMKYWNASLHFFMVAPVYQVEIFQCLVHRFTRVSLKYNLTFDSFGHWINKILWVWGNIRLFLWQVVGFISLVHLSSQPTRCLWTFKKKKNEAFELYWCM